MGESLYIPEGYCPTPGLLNMYTAGPLYGRVIFIIYTRGVPCYPSWAPVWMSYSIPSVPEVMIWNLIQPCDMDVYITHLISHMTAFCFQMVTEGYFKFLCNKSKTDWQPSKQFEHI